MNKFKQNYSLFFSALLFSGLIIFLSGCGKKQSAMSSIQYEKLRKQSIEIENGRTFASGPDVKLAPAKNGVTTCDADLSLPAKQGPAVFSEKAMFAASIDSKSTTRLSPVQKVLAKKIAKKMNLDQKTAQLDPYLKYALIFGAAGLVLSIFGYPLYFIGGILMVVGLVFLILWLLEQ